MSLDYHYHDGQMQMWCDMCHYEDTFYGSFTECIAEAKKSSWRITREKGEWMHICWQCAAKPKPSPFGVFNGSDNSPLS